MWRIGIAALILAGCQAEKAAQTVSEPVFGPLKNINDGIPIELSAVWKSRGYGWIFDARGPELRQYQVAGDTCFLTPLDMPVMTDALALSYDYYRLSDDPDRAILQLLPEDTEIHVDRIPDLPEPCTNSADPSYDSVFRYFSSVVRENYAFLERRNIDWDARVAEAREQLPFVSNDEEFFELLARMIDGFSDSHTKLLAEVNGETRRQQDGLGETLEIVRAQEIETPWLIQIFMGALDDWLDPGAEFTANDRILWGTIDEGRVGYIQILQMGGFSGVEIDDPSFRQAEFDVFDGVMDKALSAMTDAEYVILDLSNNRGGYDAISRRVAGLFTDERVAGYTTEVPGTGIPPRTRWVEPAKGTRYTGPVILLTSDVTVSGGELATLSLRELPNVTHVGETTRGSFSTVLSKPLPNGWLVELANEVIAAPDGTVYEESGIEPEHVHDVFRPDQIMESHKLTIDWILAHEGELIGSE